ncbi:MAG TPA: hypothetical protein VKN76_01505 [Kiloniellaceae bacterium]|nr:hypothetical protein [Kiloniellaceae bacterium]
MTHQDTGARWQGLKYAFLRSWQQLQGEVRSRWERLSEDDIAEIEGHLGRLTDKISQRYGVAREEAEGQIREWVSRDVPWIQQVRTVPSFRWTMIFLVAALIAAIVGFTPLTELVRSIARWVFYVSLLGFAVFLAINLSMRARK